MDLPTRGDPRDGDTSLRVDVDARAVFLGGRQLDVRLSRQEFNLISHLHEKRGQIVPREELAERIWGTVEVDGKAVPRYDDHMLHALVNRVRRKLRGAGVDLNRYLTSVPGVGYRLDAGAAAEPVSQQRRWFPLVALGVASAALVAVAVAAGLLVIDGDDDSPNAVGAATASSTGVVNLCGSELLSPVPGSALAAEATFEWTAGCGMTKYDIWIGCAPGAVDFLNPDDGAFLEATVHDLPQDGGPVFVQLTASNGTDEGLFVDRFEFTTQRAADETGTALFIPGDTAWRDTGIDVAGGQTLQVETCGQVSVNSLGDPNFQPDGNAECPGVWVYSLPAPELPCWSLIGRIGDGEPFLVGADFAEAASAAGRLYLGVNDNDVTDNGSGFRATIRVD